MNLSTKEIATLQLSVKTRQKHLKELHLRESGKARKVCDCEFSLRVLAGIANKLQNESGKESIDYSEFNVLLVDDVAFAREHTKLFLEKQGFRSIDEADDGHSAIVKIKGKRIDYDKALPYDLVLIDLNMPTISGLDVIGLIKKESRFSSIPFIVITGDKDKQHLVDAINIGVSDYITKPLNEVDFLLKVDRVLQ